MLRRDPLWSNDWTVTTIENELQSCKLRREPKEAMHKPPRPFDQPGREENMVHIISKRDGPHREEVAAKDFIQRNRTKIDGIANRLTGGHWQELRNPAPAPEPQPSGRLWSTPQGRPREMEPYVRISLNGRVVVADLSSGRQLHFVGELRGKGQSRCFALATRENGVFDPLDEELCKVLADLEGVSVPDEASEEHLEQVIAGRLGLDAIARGVD
jgi:hypothetical protein